MKHLRKIKQIVELIYIFLYDFLKFLRDYGGLARVDEGAISSWVLQDLHRIEKGMSLRNSRKDFGWPTLSRLQGNIEKLMNINPHSHILKYYVGVLREYKLKNSLPRSIELSSEKIIASVKDDALGGVVDYDVRDLEGKGFGEILVKRRSVRQYDCMVEKAIIERLRSDVKFTPTVCNRQYLDFKLLEGDELEKAICLQSGNDSFREEITQCLVVYAKTRYLVSPYERYQAFIDGGMYSMNLLNALTFYGIASCPLNWSARPSNDRALMRLKLLPKHSQVIMFISIGHIKSPVKVARSPKVNEC